MSQPHAVVIEKYREELLDQIQIEGRDLWTHLQRCDVFYPDVIADIKKRNLSEREQISELLDLLKDKHFSGFKQFMVALTQSGQEHVVERYLRDSHIHHITAKNDELVATTKLKETYLWQKLIQNRIISLENAKDIKEQFSTEWDQVRELLNHLKRQPSDQYYIFWQLRREEDNEEEYLLPVFSGGDHRTYIIDHYCAFFHKVDLDTMLWNQIIKKGVIPEDNANNIQQSHNTKRDQMDHLLFHLYNENIDCFNGFQTAVEAAKCQRLEDKCSKYVKTVAVGTAVIGGTVVGAGFVGAKVHHDLKNKPESDSSFTQEQFCEKSNPAFLDNCKETLKMRPNKAMDCLQSQNLLSDKDVCRVSKDTLDKICTAGDQGHIREMQHDLTECAVSFAEEACGVAGANSACKEILGSIKGETRECLKNRHLTSAAEICKAAIDGKCEPGDIMEVNDVKKKLCSENITNPEASPLSQNLLKGVSVVLDKVRSTSAFAGKQISIFVKTMTGRNITLGVSSDTTIKEVKKMIFDLEGMQPEYQLLSFLTKPLLDDKKIEDYYIQEGSTLHLLVRLRGGF